MSSRHLRKLELLTTQSDAENRADNCSEDESPPFTPVRPTGNVFSLLNSDSAEANSDEDSQQQQQQQQQPIAAHSALANESAGPAKISRRRKNKKKSKLRAATNCSRSDSTEPDDIDALLLHLSPPLSAGATRAPNDTTTAAVPPADDVHIMKQALNIERKHLNPDNEIRRMFGRRVLEQNGGRQRVARDHVQSVRSWSLVANTDRFAGIPSKLGLSMSAPECVGSELVFRYVHGKQYQHVERLFLAAVESVDPDNMMMLMNTYPGHVNTVLQLAELCRLSDDLPMARQLLERALYLLEAAGHPRFSVTAGTARLHYRHRENRPLFLALFRHAHALSERGCHRTALECAKLVLALAPRHDPLAVALLLDYYALRARQYRWLLLFQEQWEPVRNLMQLPCWAYSVPLARFQLAKDETDAQRAHTLRTTADRELQQALLAFPGVLPPLLEQCGLSLSSDLCRPPFDAASVASQSDALSALYHLYTERCAAVWKCLDAGSWLLQQAQQLLQLVDSGSLDTQLAAAAGNRQSRYVHMPLSVCRHIVCCDIKEARARLPPDVARHAVLSHDPLPPRDSVCAYQLQLPAPAAGSAAAAGVGPLTSFFYSMLPSFDPATVGGDFHSWADGEPGARLNRVDGAALAPAAAANWPAEAAAAGDLASSRQLYRSVNSLLAAMRRLLGDMAVTPAAEAAAAAADLTDDIGEWDDEAEDERGQSDRGDTRQQ